jgi:hypothetical protein
MDSMGSFIVEEERRAGAGVVGRSDSGAAPIA